MTAEVPMKIHPRAARLLVRDGQYTSFGLLRKAEAMNFAKELTAKPGTVWAPFRTVFSAENPQKNPQKIPTQKSAKKLFFF